MNFNKIRLSVVAGVFAVLFIALGAAQPSGLSAAARPDVPSKVMSAAASPAAPLVANWVHWGCWTQFSAGTCRDIYRDPQGDYWICRACGTTGSPGPSKCSRISPQTLQTGFWCS
jgi:hypothetical protein